MADLTATERKELDKAVRF